MQKDINILKKKLDELIQGEMSVNATAINTLKDDVSKIVKQLSNYNSLTYQGSTSSYLYTPLIFLWRNDPFDSAAINSS